MTNHIYNNKIHIAVYIYYIIPGYIVFTRDLLLPGTILRDGWILLLSPFTHEEIESQRG